MVERITFHLPPTAYRLLPFINDSNLFGKFKVELLLSNLNRCIMSHFEELKVWQKAVDLAVKVYEITKEDPFNKDFGLAL